MVFNKDEISRFLTLAAILVLAVLVFFLLKPVIIAIAAGLILTYVCLPVYKIILKVVRIKTLAALITLVILLAIVLIPLWFILPLLIQQIFEILKYTQNWDVQGLIKTVLPSSSQFFTTQGIATINAIISKASAGALNSLVDIFLQLPHYLTQLFVTCFVLFFGLRDNDKLKQMAKELSPLNKSKEKLIVQQFKGITDSIIYGHILIGIFQGIMAGVGFIIFGVPNALVLTLLTAFFSIIPMLGPYLIYIPVTIFLLFEVGTGPAVIYLLYNLLIVSTMDNLLRAYIVSRKTKINSAIVFIGMIGGLFMFGIVGLLLGPLIFAYFLILLQLYKDKELSSLFVKEEDNVNVITQENKK